MKTMVSTALSHNRAIIYYMLKTGWKLDMTVKGHVKSQADGSMPIFAISALHATPGAPGEMPTCQAANDGGKTSSASPPRNGS